MRRRDPLLAMLAAQSSEEIEAGNGTLWELAVRALARALGLVRPRRRLGLVCCFGAR
jgi:hypothetical protein